MDETPTRPNTNSAPRERQQLGTAPNGGVGADDDDDEPPSPEQLGFRSMPVEARDRIVREVEQFDAERQRLASQMGDAGPSNAGAADAAGSDGPQHELVALGRQMCAIIGQMTEFTRGSGPLRTTLDVIHAARHISALGRRFDALARRIAEACPDARSRNEVDAYLSQIDFYCHQLNITSKVKAGIQYLSPELIGIDKIHYTLQYLSVR